MESLPIGRISVPRHWQSPCLDPGSLFWDDILIHVFMASDSTLWGIFPCSLFSVDTSEVDVLCLPFLRILWV